MGSKPSKQVDDEDIEKTERTVEKYFLQNQQRNYQNEICGSANNNECVPLLEESVQLADSSICDEDVSVQIISVDDKEEEIRTSCENSEKQNVFPEIENSSVAPSLLVNADNDGNDDDENIFDTLPVQCIPPEIWEYVFGYLQDYNDCISASNACTYWRNVLQSSRQSWLFFLVFPSLLDYLSKPDVLQCRLVCKFWHSGVSYFLENNCYHRPALELVTRQPNGQDKLNCFTELRLQHLETALRTKKLAYVNLYEPEKMSLVLSSNEATSPSTTGGTRWNNSSPQEKPCPFIGRSVDMLESYRVRSPPFPPNWQFLQTFGNTLWFLRIVIENYPPAETLRRLFAMLAFLPNLKKLKVIAIIAPPRQPTEEVPETAECLRRYMERETEINFPSLETLDLTILPTRHVKIVAILHTFFATEQLQTLSVNVLPVTLNWSRLEMENLTYLSLSLDTNPRLKCLLQLNSPLQRLSLRLHGRVKAAILFQVVRHFHKTLRNLSLNFSMDFFTADIQPCINLPVQLLPFSNPTILETDFPFLKRAFLSSCRPISCNFLCGLSKTLEYLHLFMEEMGQWDRYLREGFPVQEWTERLDLLEYLKKLSSSNKLKMYESNVWKIFPRLKVLTVQVFSVKEHKKGAEWEYRRDVYDKVQSDKMKMKLAE